MFKGRELIGLPVQCKDTGEVLGRIRDLLVDTENLRLVAFVLKDGSWLREPEVIPIEGINGIDNDVLVAVDDQGPKCLDGFPELQLTNMSHLRDLSGSPVVTAGGAEIGTFQDLVVEMPQGAMTGLEISGGLVSDVISGRATISVSDVASFCLNKLVVNDELKNLWDQENPTGDELGPKEG